MLAVTAFLSGALVMVLEMVGVRVLAPHVGTSARVWTGLIGVVLAFLAAGAWAGGRLADKALSRRNLALVLAGAGLGTGLTAFAHPALGAGVAALFPNIYLAAVASAASIFVLPAFCFGMVSPYIIRLCMADMNTAGTTVGRIYALSTAGSILGTFLGGFVLISFLSSTLILWLVAISMLLLSLLHDRTRVLWRLFFLLLAVALCWHTARHGHGLWPNGVRVVESAYNTIRIMEGMDYAHGGAAVRMLATDPGFSQSGMLLRDPYKPFFPIPVIMPWARAWCRRQSMCLCWAAEGILCPSGCWTAAAGCPWTP